MQTEREIIATAHRVAESSLVPMDRGATLNLLARLEEARQAAERHLQALFAPVVRIR